MNVKAVSLFALGALFTAGAIQVHRNADANRKAAGRDAKPKPITVAELASRGPGDARYVSITGYKFDPDDVVVTKWEKADGFFSASLPLRPAGRAAVPGKSRVVVKITAKSDAEIKQYLQKSGPIVGTIINRFSHDGAEPIEWKVKGRAPEMCWFIDEGNKPIRAANPEVMMLVMGALALACFAGGALSLGGGRPRAIFTDLAWRQPAGGEGPTASGIDLRSAAFLPNRVDHGR